MRLLLVRHPRPDIGPGLCYGSSDIGVTAAQLHETLASLRAQGLPGALPVYASPLRRCAGLARALHPTPLFDPRLAEMDFGGWELRSWENIPRVEVDAWVADLLHYRPGGGESVLAVAQRVAGFHADLLCSGVREALVICHAGTMRLLAALHSGQPLAAAAFEAARTPHRIDYGQMLMLED